MPSQSYCFLQCPIGTIRLRASEKGLIAVDHVNQQAETSPDWTLDETHSILQSAVEELTQYFSGECSPFKTALAPVGTAFQLSVWDSLKRIPYGETISYADVSDAIGKPKAVRAVGGAIGKNPLSIFIPCHRVIGKSGKLTGYAGGIKVKETLLRLEHREQENLLF